MKWRVYLRWENKVKDFDSMDAAYQYCSSWIKQSSSNENLIMNRLMRLISSRDACYNSNGVRFGLEKILMAERIQEKN